MSRSIKKGPFCAPELLKRVDEMNQTGDKKVLKTLSRASTIFPLLRGSHLRRPRRPQARARLCDRGYGRPQAGRVRSHPHLQGPCGFQDR